MVAELFHKVEYISLSYMYVPLQANDCNIEISAEGEGEKAVDTMALKLLSANMAHEAMSSYRAPSMHGQTQSPS